MSFKKQTSVKIVIVAVVVSALLAGAYFAGRATSSDSSKSSQAAKNAKLSKDVKTAVGDIMLLPKDTQPIVAKIDDTKPLLEKNKEFFKDAKKGDFILYYKDQAIIYRRSSNMIINVAPIVNSPAGQDTTTTTPETTTTKKK